MRITTEILEDLEACTEGVEAFKKAYPDGWEGEWTEALQLKVLLSPLNKYLGWAWWEKLLPQWNLSNANLRYADLSNADLRYADLRNANLSNADLSNANLRYANTNEYTRFPEGYKKDTPV